MKYKIEYVKNIPHANGYVGMNAEAASELHIPFKHKHPIHTVVTLHSQRPAERRSTIAHEEVENYFMRVKHMHYPKAHHLALQYEKLHKPFSVQRAKKLLAKKCK